MADGSASKLIVLPAREHLTVLVNVMDVGIKLVGHAHVAKLSELKKAFVHDVKSLDLRVLNL